ncbi:MAG TPA: restriction endonuclease subunit S [Haliscomenobacter sp.]|uniref:restriction endonuclease subunit S n=1 Tax=Haliscomenobacter sp. TaxID=2717303 RepID=UPI002B68354C|nr:restriction endonuclease subunit S [Haliscomenobacter sp.]HOY17767.1 restriction endonuclease subunit S [Haliscomenobacter sp.]HPH21481.1 restriction endonuclease subunit S [Haliscomenobacter sp.]
MMKFKDWKMVKLGEVLKRQYYSVEIDDLKKYKRLTVKTKGQGITLRDEVIGAEIGTKNQYKVKGNQFLLSKIDAMNGAFGIIPQECDGGVITGNFWTYDFEEIILDRNYLNYLCVGGVFTKFSLEASEGTTNRKYLKEEAFLDQDLFLPPLPEQQRIVAHLTALQNKIEAIKRLRSEQEKTVKNLLYSLFVKTIEKAEWVKMGEVAPIIRRDVSISENGFYPELGIRSFGKGTFHKPALKGLEVGTKRLYQIETSDLLFSNVFAWEGAIAVAQAKDHGRFGSHRFISCLCDTEKILPDFLCFYFLTEAGMEKINKASPGGAGRNKTLGLTKLEQIEVPIPTIEHQRAFILTQAKLQAAKQLQSTQLESLNGLLPSVLDKAFRGEL